MLSVLDYFSNDFLVPHNVNLPDEYFLVIAFIFSILARIPQQRWFALLMYHIHTVHDSNVAVTDDSNFDHLK